MSARILLIDDDPAVLRSLEIVLVDLGYDVVAALGGVEGVERFRTCAPDLVVTDIIMPEKDGIEVIREIRRANANVRIIAISGGGRTSKRELLRLAGAFGADAVLAKPFDDAALAATIESCLGSA
jgi:CheY-like chemotaxis protein